MLFFYLRTTYQIKQNDIKSLDILFINLIYEEFCIKERYKMKKIAGAIVVALVMIMACIFYVSSNNEGYIDINPSDLEEIVDKEAKVYVYFYSENCITCRKIKSNLKELKKENSELIVYGVNVDKYKYSSFIDEYSGHKVPKVVEFIEGSKYKELNDNSIDALREFIIVSNKHSYNKPILTGDSSDKSIVDNDDNNEDKISKVDIYYFYSTTCSSCEKTSKYIDKLEKEYSNIEIKKYNIYQGKNEKYLKKYCQEYSVDKESFGMVPIVFIRDKYLLDYKDIYEKLERYIQSNNNIPTKVISYKVVENNDEIVGWKSLNIIKVMLAALINGINPCSISMLLFLLILLNNKSKSLLKMGLGFCAGKVISTFLIGSILYKLLKYLSGYVIIEVVNIIFICLFLFLAVLNLYDFVVIRNHEYGKIKAQLPTGFRKFNHGIMKNTVNRFFNSKWIILSCVILGAVVAFTEFLCSGQIYLSTIVAIIHSNEGSTVQGLVYLLIYCLVCILPLVFIIFLMSKGIKEIEVSTFFTEHLDKIKLIYAVVFLIVAIYMIVQMVV